MTVIASRSKHSEAIYIDEYYASSFVGIDHGGSTLTNVAQRKSVPASTANTPGTWPRGVWRPVAYAVYHRFVYVNSGK